MFCPNCGKELEDESKFCNRCGEKIDNDKTTDENNKTNSKNAGVDFAVDVYPHYGSDAEAALRAGYDVRHGLIGAGVYASHGYERSHVEGVQNTLLLLKSYLG